MDLANIELMSKLKRNITRKLNKQDELIDIKNLYGVFIAEDDNKFLICKDLDEKDPYLCEFFTNEPVDYSDIIFNRTICSWRKSGKHYSGILNGMYFCLPLINLLGKNHKNGKVNKKDLGYLYCIVNEYLKKKPEFIDELIKNEKVR